MTFGQQPQNNGQYNPQYNTSDYNTAQQNYQYAAQGTGAGTAAINTTMTYSSSRFVWFRWVLPWCSALASPK